MKSDTNTVHDYARAKALATTITPIRGTTIRPLGDRRRKHEHIRMNGDAVVVGFHGTDVATYFPDGVITVNLDGWPTRTTFDFINRVLPDGLRVGTTEGIPIICVRSWYTVSSEQWGSVRKYKYYEYMLDSMVDVKFGPNGWAVASKVEPCVVHKMNRKEVSDARGKLKVFTDYVKGAAKLTGWGNSRVRYAMHRPSAESKNLLYDMLEVGVAQVPDNSEVMDTWGAAAQELINTYASEEYFNKFITREIIASDPDKMLVPVELPEGTVKKDRYAKFM